MLNINIGLYHTISYKSNKLLSVFKSGIKMDNKQISFKGIKNKYACFWSELSTELQLTKQTKNNEITTIIINEIDLRFILQFPVNEIDVVCEELFMFEAPIRSNYQ